MTAKPDGERFQNGAHKYAAYLETPEGRLRSDLAFANLQDFLPRSQAENVRCVHWISGAAQERRPFAWRDLAFTSRCWIPLRRCWISRSAQHRKQGLRTRSYCNTATLPNWRTCFPLASFDVILCHNILEYVDDPDAVLRGAARALRDSSAILSVLVRNQAGEVFKAAIQAGDLAAAENNLTAEWGQESLYGGRVRLFTSDSLQAMLKAASLAMIAERGVRVLADYLPPQVSRSAEYERILELERKLGSRPEFAAVARYTQCFARRANPVTEDGA